MTFKCPSNNCHVRTKSRKAISLHYKKIHVLTHYCTLCTKKYTTPYGLRQHQYMHLLKSRISGHTCGRCKKTFPFSSQLKIHHLSHARKQKYECEECSTTYKFKHDMQRHKREHNAPIEQCSYCDYTGSFVKRTCQAT